MRPWPSLRPVQLLRKLVGVPGETLRPKRPTKGGGAIDPEPIPDRPRILPNRPGTCAQTLDPAPSCQTAPEAPILLQLLTPLCTLEEPYRASGTMTDPLKGIRSAALKRWPCGSRFGASKPSQTGAMFERFTMQYAVVDKRGFRGWCRRRPPRALSEPNGFRCTP